MSPTWLEGTGRQWQGCDAIAGVGGLEGLVY